MLMLVLWEQPVDEMAWLCCDFYMCTLRNLALGRGVATMCAGPWVLIQLTRARLPPDH